jgi:hypothetical protein
MEAIWEIGYFKKLSPEIVDLLIRALQNSTDLTFPQII